MPNRHRPSMGQAISTFSFLLFALLLGLASLIEGFTLRGILIGLCAFLSLAGAFRFRIQTLVTQWKDRNR